VSPYARQGVLAGRDFVGYTEAAMIVPPLHHREAERLALLRRCAILDTDAEAEIDDLVELAASIADTPIALVSLIDQGRQWFKGRYGLAARETERDVAFCAHAILDAERPMIVEDARTDPRFAGNRLVDGDPGVIFYAGFPLLITPERLPMGTLCVIDRERRSLTPQALRRLRVLARQVELLLEIRLRKVEMEGLLAEQVLHEQRDRLLAKVAAQVPGMVYQYVRFADGSGRFTYCSPGVEAIHGFTPDQVAQSHQPVIDRLHPDDRAMVLASIARSAEEMSLWSCEYRYCHPDGRTLWLAGHASPERRADGALLWHGFITDITERRRAGTQIRELKDQLEDAIESLNAGFVMFDADERLVLCNKRYRELYHIPPDILRPGVRYEDVIRRTMSADPEHFRKLLGGEDLDAYVARRMSVIRGSTACPPQQLGERWVQVDEMRSRSGGFISLRTDITEMVQREAQLTQALKDLGRSTAEAVHARQLAESASRAKAEFLATMSHEIRTPMNGVIGMTSLLMDTALNPEQREWVEAIRMSGDALLTIINDILDFSKIEAGRLDIEPIRFDLRSATEDVIELLSAKAAEKGIDLLLDYPDDVAHQLVGDEGRLRQILLNLVSNAVKFTEQGAVVVAVKETAREGRAVRLQLAVDDTGIGMNAEQLAGLFQPFRQADASTSRRFGGTGLGLAICDRLSRLMQGAIHASSTPGRGSRFVLDIALDLDREAEDGAAQAQRRILQGQPVLVLSDRQPSGAILVRALRAWGMSVDEADDSATAARAAASWRAPGLVVLDQRKTAGAIPLLESLDLGVDTMPVMLTAQGLRGEADRLAGAGFRAYFTRPLRLAMMRQGLSEIVARERTGERGRQLVTRHSLAQDAPAIEMRQPPNGDAARRWRILLAEDNSINQKVAAHLLERQGCVVDLAGNGAETVELAMRAPYDLILMDCQMPEMDGYEAARAIRSGHGPCRAIPIIALTANAMLGDRELCVAAGMNDYLGKPISARSLADALGRWLGEGALARTCQRS
jgi:PAS domain S-box-containing protein